MLVLDERQQNLLMTLKQSMDEESNKKNIYNKKILLLVGDSEESYVYFLKNNIKNFIASLLK